MSDLLKLIAEGAVITVAVGMFAWMLRHQDDEF